MQVTCRTINYHHASHIGRLDPTGIACAPKLRHTADKGARRFVTHAPNPKAIEANSQGTVLTSKASKDSAPSFFETFASRYRTPARD
jgi:hypothetical protein